MSARLLRKLAEHVAGGVAQTMQPPSSLHPLSVQPAFASPKTTVAADPQTSMPTLTKKPAIQPMGGFGTGGLSDLSHVYNSTKRLAVGGASLGAAGVGNLISKPLRLGAELGNRLAPSGEGWRNSALDGFRDFDNRMNTAATAAALDVGHAFSPESGPTASQVNTENNAYDLESMNQPSAANLTRMFHTMGEGAAGAVPAAGAAKLLSGLPAMSPVVAPGQRLLNVARTAVPWAANGIAQSQAVGGVAPPLGTVVQRGLDAVPIGDGATVGDVTRTTAGWAQQGQEALNKTIGPRAGNMLTGVAPYLLPGVGGQIAPWLAQSPLGQQPPETIDKDTGILHPTYTETDNGPQLTKDLAVDDWHKTPLIDDPRGKSPLAATAEAPPPGASRPLDMFQHLANGWKNLDKNTQMMLLAGGGLGLLGLGGGHPLATMATLAMAGLAAHHGLFGEQAQQMLHSVGNSAGGLLGLSNQPGGAGGKSQAGGSMNLSTLRMADKYLPMSMKTWALKNQLQANPELKMQLRQLPQSGAAQLGNRLLGNPALSTFQEHVPGATQEDFDHFRDIYRATQQAYPDQVRHNVPAKLDAVDTIRNSVNANGNVPQPENVA